MNKKSLYYIKGFTLIELLVVVAILGIIATIGLLNFGDNLGAAKREDAKVSLQKIKMMQEQYILENNLTNYWNTGNSCNDYSTTIETKLFFGENSLSKENFYYCIISFETTGYKAKAISKKNGEELWIDHKNNNNW